MTGALEARGHVAVRGDMATVRIAVLGTFDATPSRGETPSAGQERTLRTRHLHAIPAGRDFATQVREKAVTFTMGESG